VPDTGVLDLGFHVFDPVDASFVRGDADGDGTFLGLGDALELLRFHFLAGNALPCFDAADADDNGSLNGIVDGILILAFQFLPGTPPPPPPGPMSCGFDPTLDVLGCATPPPCS